MQRSANNACMAEAKAWMNGAIVEIATDKAIVNAYSPKACDTGDGANNAPAAGKTFENTAKVYFKAQIRGNKAKAEGTVCDAISGSCEGQGVGTNNGTAPGNQSNASGSATPQQTSNS